LTYSNAFALRDFFFVQKPRASCKALGISTRPERQDRELIEQTGPSGAVGDGFYNLRGWLAGGEFAYNWQYGDWVLGVVGDYSGGSIRGSSNLCGVTTLTPHACGTSLNSLGTAREVLGYAVGAGGSWLPYITGGVAFGNVDAWDALTTASGSASRIGWTAGAGLAVMVAPRWIVKFEYLHVDLGSANLFDVVPGVPEKVSFRSDLFRLGVSFQFGQPVVQPVQPLYRKY
jgi:outer membrane immunogenic protein